MAEKEVGYFEFRIRITNNESLKRINELSQKKGMKKTILLRELIDKGLDVMEEELKTNSEKQTEMEILEKQIDMLIEQNKLILDRQMTSRVYDKVIEKVCNSIYQYVLLLLPFTTNGRFDADKTFIKDVLNKTPTEIAGFKNDLLYQLVQGSDLLDKNEEDVK